MQELKYIVNGLRSQLKLRNNLIKNSVLLCKWVVKRS